MRHFSVTGPILSVHMLGMTTTLFDSVPLKHMDPSAPTMAIFDEIPVHPGDRRRPRPRP